MVNGPCIVLRTRKYGYFDTAKSPHIAVCWMELRVPELDTVIHVKIALETVTQRYLKHAALVNRGAWGRTQAANQS